MKSTSLTSPVVLNIHVTCDVDPETESVVGWGVDDIEALAPGGDDEPDCSDEAMDLIAIARERLQLRFERPLG